ncbi:MAG: PAS domain S-box protein [Deltaproteobacteria bacterium]|nr:PAS domain S-box protein [Deltaproteobacteria bacterium]
MEKIEENSRIKADNLFLEALFDGISEEIMVIDGNGSIQEVNKVFLDECGLTRKEVIGEKCYTVRALSGSLCHIGTQYCPLEKAKETGKRVEITHHYGANGVHSKEFSRIMYPISAGGKSGQFFVEISRDVTEYRNLIGKLKASKKRFGAILDTATDAIISINRDHKIVLFNNAAQRIFGYSSDEVLGKNLNMLIPSQYGDHYRFVSRFLETKTPKVMGKALHLTGVRKNGEEFPIELGLSFYETEENITITAIIRDISAQKQLEKKLLQSERLAAVGQTVAHVAHEIKNPLMIIGGFSQQIRESLNDEKAIRKVDMILDEVSRLERLVAGIGDFTKVHSLVERTADINSVIQDVLKIMGGVYSSEKHHFRANLASDLREVDCDPDKLKQVFINIITNGIEAMEDGGVITITTQQSSDSIEIRISDEGIGISETDLLHIFEPFFTTRDRGFGLGLAISYKLVEAHRGEIWADSVPGQGTTFVVRLPLR